LISKHFPGAKRYGKPKDWDNEKGSCVGLSVIEEDINGLHVCQSIWEPTPDELEILKNGGHVVLSVIGGQPPVSLTSIPRIQEDEE
jgi:hypothetical protein